MRLKLIIASFVFAAFITNAHATKIITISGKTSASSSTTNPSAGTQTDTYTCLTTTDVCYTITINNGIAHETEVTPYVKDGVILEGTPITITGPDGRKSEGRFISYQNVQSQYSQDILMRDHIITISTQEN